MPSPTAIFMLEVFSLVIALKFIVLITLLQIIMVKGYGGDLQSNLGVTLIIHLWDPNMVETEGQ